MKKEILIDNFLIQEVIKIMMKAHESILNIYSLSKFEIDYKQNNTPVTQADLLAHQIITKGLNKLTPYIPIVSEEDENSFYLNKGVKCYWIIDPLDGTKEFIKKTGEFTCNIGLIKNSQPLYGFVGIPTNGLIYHGGKDYGSYKRTDDLNETQIKCSERKDPLRIIMSKSHINKETKEYVEGLDIPYVTIQAGSSLKFIKVAEGDADIYPRLGLTSEWDTAAAHAVLEGAGGLVLQLNGNELIYGKDNILNPYFLAESNKN